MASIAAAIGALIGGIRDEDEQQQWMLMVCCYLPSQAEETIAAMGSVSGNLNFLMSWFESREPRDGW